MFSLKTLYTGEIRTLVFEVDEMSTGPRRRQGKGKKNV
jgi:hypothetical protein